MSAIVSTRPRPRLFALVGGALLAAAVAGPVLLLPAAAASASVTVATAATTTTSTTVTPASVDDGFVIPRGSAAASLARAELARSAEPTPAR